MLTLLLLFLLFLFLLLRLVVMVALLDAYLCFRSFPVELWRQHPLQAHCWVPGATRRPGVQTRPVRGPL
jgi:hypothetical protein